MPPQQPHFPWQNDMAQDETPTVVSQPASGLPPLSAFDDAPPVMPPHAAPPSGTTRPNTGRPTRPRSPRSSMPIHPPKLAGLEDEVRSADSEVRAEARSMALAPVAAHGTLASAGSHAESGALLIRGADKPRRPAVRVVPRRSGPYSFLMQFVVAMLATVVLVSTLTLTTPLGQSMAAATSLQFSTSSGAFIHPPTPTATATPKPKYYAPNPGNNPGTQAIINDIIAVFGPYAQGALNIARCESGYDPNAVNSYPIGNSHASGVFQILYPSTWDTTSYAAYSPFDYDKNIHAAYQIFHRDGNSWREWACKSY